MEREFFQHDGLKLSYIDFGGSGQELIALHAHWMEGMTFRLLAQALAPEWRVVALDQRGHGYSDHASSYTREDYLGDLTALLLELGIDSAVFLGNSLGGVNAYQFAARFPGRVRALIVEDIGAEVHDDTSFALAWRGVFLTRNDLAACVGPRLLPYLQDSFRGESSGWHLAFDPQDTVASQLSLNGDHWQDWVASSCPALLIRGSESRVTSPEHLREMAARRPNTDLQVVAGGHVCHIDNPAGFSDLVRKFLSSLMNRPARTVSAPR